MDDSGDVWSESHIIASAATPAQIEAYIDALQADSGASIYMVGVQDVWGTEALADPENAEGNTDLLKSPSVFDSLNVTLKHNTDPEKKNKIVRIPAPLKSNFIVSGDYTSDTINGASVELAAVMAAALTLFGAANWSIAWARYSEKTELNERTRI